MKQTSTFRVAPDVRLRASRRGPRTTLGPRLRRVVTDRTRLSGDDLAATWSSRAGGGRTSSRHTTGARDADDWATVRDHLDRLRSAHTTPITRSMPPVADPPAHVDASSVRRELRSEATADLRRWEIGARRAAARAASQQVDAEVTRRRHQAAQAAGDAQAHADLWWERLCANDPMTVTDHLERILSEHATPATVASVEEDRVHLVVSVLPVHDLIGPREPMVDDDGEVALKRVTESRRHALYRATIESSMLAVAVETFAAAPGASVVGLAVVDAHHLGGPAVLMLAELPRELVLPDHADRAALDDLIGAASAGRATLVRDRGERIGALRPLDDVPGVRALLAALDVD